MDRPLQKGKEKVIWLMKDELGGKVMRKFVGLWSKTYSYLRNHGSEDKKAEGTKNCVIKRKLKIWLCLDNLFYFQVELSSWE